MAARAGRLQVQLELEVASLRRELAETNKAIGNATDQWADQFNKVGKNISNALQTLGIIEAFNQIKAKVSSVIEEMANIGDKFSILQDSAENFQRLDQAAKLAGISIDDVANASGRLQKQLDSLTATKAGQSALKQLGVDIESLKNMSPTDAFIKVAGALGDVENSAKQAAIGSALFGKSWQTLLPLIGQGEQGLRDAADAAVVFSDEAIKAADDFADSWDAMQHSVSVAIGEAIKPALPAFTELAKGMTASGTAAEDAGKDYLGLGEMSKAMATVLNDTIGAVQSTGIAFVALGKTIGSSLAAIMNAFGIYQNTLRYLVDNPTSFFNQDFWKAARGMIGSEAGNLTETLKGIESEANAKLAAVQSRVTATNSAIANAKLEPVEARKNSTAATDDDTEATTKNTAAKRESTKALKENNDAYKDAQRAADEYARQMDSLTAVYRDIEEERMRQNGATEEQIRLWRLDADGADEMTRRLSEAQARLKEFQDGTDALRDSQQKQREEQEKQTKAMADYLESGFTDIFNSILQGSDAAIDSVKRLVAQLLTAIATAKLMQLFGGSGQIQWPWMTQAKGGAWLNGVKYFAQGAVFGSPTAFSYGGGNIGVLGEDGPEAVMPLKRGADGKLGVSGGGHNVQVFNYSGASIDVTSDEENLRIVVDRVRSIMSSDVVRGGNSFASAIERTYGVRR